METAEAFLKTVGPMHLRGCAGRRALPDRAGGRRLRRARGCSRASARSATRASSRRRRSSDAAARKAWFEEAVRSRSSSTNNFLSDDRRYSVRELGTNVARAMATNAQKGHVWEEFSSETYKQLPPAGNITGLYNPRKPDEPISVERGAGRLLPDAVARLDVGDGALPAQQRARDVREGSVGRRTDVAFNDAVEKLLWPEKRLGVQSMIVTSIAERADHRRPRQAGPDSGGHAGRPDRARRSDAAAGDRAQPRGPEPALGRGAVPRASCATTSRPTSCSIAATRSARS